MRVSLVCPSPGFSVSHAFYQDYVLQRAVSVADQEQKRELISRIKPQLVSMRRYSSAYSKHLLSSKQTHLSTFPVQT
jgi:pumilio RNA-binding family